MMGEELFKDILWEMTVYGSVGIFPQEKKGDFTDL
jgi:hypothetical protein